MQFIYVITLYWLGKIFKQIKYVKYTFAIISTKKYKCYLLLNYHYARSPANYPRNNNAHIIS